MFTKEASIHVEASPETVFDYVSDLRKHPEWAAQRMEMDVHGDSIGAGTTFSAVTYFMGKETCEGKVLAFDRPSRFSYQCDTSTSGKAIWTFEVQPEGSGSKLTHRYQRLEAALWFKVSQAALFPLVGRKMVTNGLANIKRRIESPVAAGS